LQRAVYSAPSDYLVFFCDRSGGRSWHPIETERLGAGFCASLDNGGGSPWAKTRKIAAILVADIVGYSRLAGADEDRMLFAAQRATERSD
jgi:class 3 adenylate cyclase